MQNITGMMQPGPNKKTSDSDASISAAAAFKVSLSLRLTVWTRDFGGAPPAPPRNLNQPGPGSKSLIRRTRRINNNTFEKEQGD